jgi:hypothetical protein
MRWYAFALFFLTGVAACVMFLYPLFRWETLRLDLGKHLRAILPCFHGLFCLAAHCPKNWVGVDSPYQNCFPGTAHGFPA